MRLGRKILRGLGLVAVLIPACVLTGVPEGVDSPYCPPYAALNPVARFKSAAGWMDYDTGVFCNNMESHWQQVRVPGYPRPQNVQGCNYFTFPKPVAPATYSAHFDAKSPYFDAFFGVYVVPPLNGKPLPLDMKLIAELGDRDNQAWLQFMGDPQYKKTSTQVVSEKCLATNPATRACVKKEGVIRFNWHVDVGSRNPTTGVPPLWIVPASAWNGTVKSYQNAVQVPANFLVWYEGPYLIVNFAIGEEFTTLSGQKINTYTKYPELREGLAQMTATVQAIDNGSPYRCADSVNRSQGAPREHHSRF